jgi:hypothetical protein
MKRQPRLECEPLEDRLVPADFGVPWINASHLTLSFAPDGTAIAGHQSSLFGSLNAQMPTAVWEGLILQAFQTWAIQTNINIGVVSDGGQPFGVPGLTQGDTRFGDIRIGAQPMTPDTLAIAVPHDPYLSGTWAGDILMNSAVKFGGPQSDLLAVMLHEVGHALGLPDSTDRLSVMYPEANYTSHTLAPSDVTAIQNLYGVRLPDSGEGLPGDGQYTNSVLIPYPPGGDDSSEGAYPLVSFGELSVPRDVDVFRVRTPAEYSGPVTFHLQTAGISLLEPRLVVLDRNGVVLGAAQSTLALGDTVTVTLTNLSANTVYWIRVRPATTATGLFTLGRYGLAVTFDAALSVPPQTINLALLGSYASLSADQLDEIFSNPGGVLFNDQHGTNSTFATATPLVSAAGYVPSTHYEQIESLGDSSDHVYFRLTAPTTGTTMTVTVNALAVNGLVSKVQVYNAQQQPVAGNIVLNGNGTYTMQVPQFQQGATYYLQFSADDGGVASQGNFYLTVDFQQPAAILTQDVAGALSALPITQTGTLYVARPQLFQFLLAAQFQGTPSGVSLQMTIIDSSGNVVYTLASGSNVPTSGPAILLVPGQYTVQFTEVLTGTASPVPVTYQLFGATLSDPIGPAVNDPTLAPLYTNPNDPTHYHYPNGTVSGKPYLFFLG